MLVVADTSPLITLITIRHADLLPQLFGEVVLPPAVIAELTRSSRPAAVLGFLKSRPNWLIERTPSAVATIAALHPGELAAIALALELHADLLLIDEREGRRAASTRGLRFIGTIGLLELAARKGYIDLPDAFERVKATDFWVSPRFLDERLRLFRKSQGL